MRGYLVYCVLVFLFACLFVCLFVRLQIFSAAEKDRGVKFCMRVGLLSGQVFSNSGELWLAGSHGGNITFAMSEPSGTHSELAPKMTNAARLSGHLELGVAASCKAVW